MSYLSQKDLLSFGFKELGQNVKISDKVSLYGTQYISIGSNVRIDDFCILSAGEGGIFIGDYVHIACYSSLIGKEKIQLDDFSGLSSRVSVYSSSDDYSGSFLTNPTVPNTYTNIISGMVIIQKHVIIGANVVILPNVTIGIGSAIGALSLVTKSVEPFCISSGVPARFLKKRKENLLLLEEKLKINLK